MHTARGRPSRTPWYWFMPPHFRGDGCEVITGGTRAGHSAAPEHPSARAAREDALRRLMALPWRDQLSIYRTLST